MAVNLDITTFRPMLLYYIDQSFMPVLVSRCYLCGNSKGIYSCLERILLHFVLRKNAFKVFFCLVDA